MYRFFYNHEASKDTLFLVFNPNGKVNRVVKKDDLAVLYQDDELLGINFFKISKLMKIKASGMIPLPGEAMLERINSLLANNNLPLLEPLTYSGYRVFEVISIEEHPVDEKALIVVLSDGSKEYQTVSRDLTLKVGEKVVGAIEGCIFYDGSLITRSVEKNLPIEVRICSALELKISSEDKIAFRVEEERVGSDFFLGE